MVDIVLTLTTEEIETLLMAISDARAERLSSSEEAKAFDDLAKKIEAQLPR